MNSASTISPNAKAATGLYRVGVGAKVGQTVLLEQRIAVFAEGNTDKQSEIAQDGGVLTPISSKEVALVAGYGSPAHLAAIRLFDDLPPGVEIKFFFVPEDVAGTITNFSLAGTGATVTATGVIQLNVNGSIISVTLLKDDTLAEALVKIKDAINAAINLPCLVATVTPVADIDIDSKWKGQSSAELNVIVESNTSTGITFALIKTAGTGQVIPTTELAKLTNDWYVHILNCLGNGISNAILDEYESFNGTAANGNGKYLPTNMTPFIAWTGSHESVLANITAITEPRLDSNTNQYISVTNAQDFTFLNAAELLAMFVKKSSPDPKRDILDDKLTYAIPPTDGDVGDIMDYNYRNALVEAGASTVNFKNDQYYANDILTTYHPAGEVDPVFSYVRDNMIVFNLIEGIKQFNQRHSGKTIAPNALPNANITSPALYKAGLLNEIIKPFVDDGYIADFDYAKENLDVGIDENNAGRFNVVTKELVTSLLRIIAVDIEVNKFNG